MHSVKRSLLAAISLYGLTTLHISHSAAPRDKKQANIELYNAIMDCDPQKTAAALNKGADPNALLEPTRCHALSRALYDNFHDTKNLHIKMICVGTGTISLVLNTVPLDTLLSHDLNGLAPATNITIGLLISSMFYTGYTAAQAFNKVFQWCPYRYDIVYTTPPLIFAAAHRASDAQIAIVNQLIAHKADPNIQDEKGNTTALEYAVRHNNIPLAHILLAAKANPLLPDIQGRTPLDKASSDSFMKSMLLKAQKKALKASVQSPATLAPAIKTKPDIIPVIASMATPTIPTPPTRHGSSVATTQKKAEPLPSKPTITRAERNQQRKQRENEKRAAAAVFAREKNLNTYESAPKKPKQSKSAPTSAAAVPLKAAANPIVQVPSLESAQPVKETVLLHEEQKEDAEQKALEKRAEPIRPPRLIIPTGECDEDTTTTQDRLNRLLVEAFTDEKYGIVMHLIKQGANPCAGHPSVIDKARAQGTNKAIALAGSMQQLAQNWDIYKESLFLAAQANNIAYLDILFKELKNTSAMTVDFPLQNTHTNVLNYLNENGETAVFCAIQQGNYTFANYLLQKFDVAYAGLYLPNKQNQTIITMLFDFGKRAHLESCWLSAHALTPFLKDALQSPDEKIAHKTIAPLLNRILIHNHVYLNTGEYSVHDILRMSRNPSLIKLLSPLSP